MTQVSNPTALPDHSKTKWTILVAVVLLANSLSKVHSPGWLLITTTLLMAGFVLIAELRDWAGPHASMGIRFLAAAVLCPLVGILLAQLITWVATTRQPEVVLQLTDRTAFLIPCSKRQAPLEFRDPATDNTYKICVARRHRDAIVASPEAFTFKAKSSIFGIYVTDRPIQS